MNLETRKIEFVQEFLKIQSEEIIALLENALRINKKGLKKEEFKPFTEEEIHSRLDKSEADFENNRFKTNAELLTKYE